MATEQRLNTIVINKVENKAVYDNMLSRGLVKDDEFYLVNDSEEIKVKSVNGNTPNADGDVTLTASDVGASTSDHNHDDRYYTESETNALLNNKANSSDLNNYLLKSGGTLKGPSVAITNNGTDNYVMLCGGTGITTGSWLALSGGTRSGMEGVFRLAAGKDANFKYLQGNPDGTLTWDGNNIALAKDYLPLSGGTITGVLKTTAAIRPTVISFPDGGSQISVGEYNNGADLVLIKKDANSNAGRFYLRASVGNGSSALVGDASGTLTWVSKDVSVIDSSGTNYIRYTNGLQICWGDFYISSANDGGTLTFPMPFTSFPYLAWSVHFSALYQNAYSIQTTNRTGSNCKVFICKAGAYGDGNIRFMAIGYWKQVTK